MATLSEQYIATLKDVAKNTGSKRRAFVAQRPLIILIQNRIWLKGYKGGIARR